MEVGAAIAPGGGGVLFGKTNFRYLNIPDFMLPTSIANLTSSTNFHQTSLLLNRIFVTSMVCGYEHRLFWPLLI